MQIKGIKNTTINQHIVPQRHLKNFSTPNDPNKIIAFDCDNNMIIKKIQSIKHICSADFHYALKPGVEDEYSQIVEDEFGKLEYWYGDNIDRIENAFLNKDMLCDSDRFKISCVIANFFFRAQNFRNETLNATSELLDWIHPIISEHINNEVTKRYPDVFSDKEKNKEIVNNVIREEFNNIASKTSHATNSAFDIGLVNTLTHKKWNVYLNKTNYPFITSDEPVVDLINSDIPENYMLRGAWLLKTQIFSLTPKVSITLSFPSTEDLHGKLEYIEITEKVEVFKQNLYYINFSHKYAYAPNNDFFLDLISLKNLNSNVAQRPPKQFK